MNSPRGLLALVLVLGASVPVPALAAPRPLTPHDAAALRTVASVHISPDGDHVAHVLRVPRDPLGDEDGEARSELHVTGPDGVTRPFVTDEAGVSRVAWRPGGRELTFLAERDGDEAACLYTIPIDGGEARRLLAHDTAIREYAWNPDGRRLAFRARAPEPETRKELRERGFDRKVVEEELRRDLVYVVDLAEAGAEPRALDLEGHATHLLWDPAGERLALTLAPTPLVDDSYMERRVRVVSARDGAILGRIETPGKLGSVSWSPDGTRLAIIAAEDRHDPREGRLTVVPAGGGVPRDLLPGLEGHVRQAEWRDERTLLYVADIGVETVVAELDAGDPPGRIRGPGEEPAPVTPRIVFSEAGRIVRDLSLSGDGTRAAARLHTAAHPDEAFRFDPVTGELDRLTFSNPVLETAALAPQEPLTWTARDGLRLEGILIRPLDEEPGRRYPLILVVHGGPESHYRNGWMTSTHAPGQVAAGRGFAVLHPNYRASTGRGVAFSRLDHGDMAGPQFDDLVDAIDHLARIGLVDRERVGVTGGSYGGYASAWCATALSEHFAASVMNVGLSNQLSFFGTTDIPNEMNLVHYRMWPWEDWEFFLERSPIRYVERARTPILICHGEADTRVYPGQSMELFRYLKTYGEVPVRLVLYPGEGHGSKRAASRLDYALRLIRWMEHYLKGPGGDPPPPEIDYDPAAWGAPTG